MEAGDVFSRCILEMQIGFPCKIATSVEIIGSNSPKSKKKKKIKKLKKILGEKGIRKSFVISTQISSRGLLARRASFVYDLQSKRR